MARKKHRNNGQQAAGSDLSFEKKKQLQEQKKKDWISGKIAQAGQDDYNVIRQRTPDVALLVNLANPHDNIMEHLRMNNIINPKIDIQKYARVVAYSNIIKALLDRVNAMANGIVGRNYKTHYRAKALVNSVRNMNPEDLKQLLNEMTEMLQPSPPNSQAQQATGKKSEKAKTERVKAAASNISVVPDVPVAGVAAPVTDPVATAV